MSLKQAAIIGLVARLLVGWLTPAPFYYDHFARDVEVWAQHGNIYAEQQFYNYSPLPMHLLGISAWTADRLGLPPHVGFRLLFIVGDALIFLVLLREGRNARAAQRFWLNPAHIVFSAYLCSFEGWAVLPILLAVQRRNVDALALGIVAVLLKQNVAFLVWTLYVYRYGVGGGALMLMATAAAFAFSFVSYLPAGAEGIWRNVLTYGGGEMYGLGLLLPRWMVAAVLFPALLALPVLLKRRGVDLRRALFLSALTFCGLAWGASPAMFALPLLLAFDNDEEWIALSVIGFLLFSPLTWNLASAPIFRVSWFCCLGAVALRLSPLIRPRRRPQSSTPTMQFDYGG